MHRDLGIVTCLKPAVEDIVIGLEAVEVGLEANGRLPNPEVVLPSGTVSRLALRRIAPASEEQLAIPRGVEWDVEAV